MKKSVIIFIALILSAISENSAFAQTKVSIKLLSGNEQIYFVDELGKITFSETNLVIDEGDGQTASIELLAIQRIIFDADVNNTELEEQTDLMIYPNPTSAVLRIANRSGEKLNVSVYTLDGRMVLVNESITDNQIDVSRLSKGLYLIQVNGQTFKFSKQ